MWAITGAPLVRPCMPTCSQIRPRLPVCLGSLRKTSYKLKCTIVEVPKARKRGFMNDKRSTRVSVVCSSVKKEQEKHGGSGIREWIKKKIEDNKKAQVAPGEKVMRMVATAASAPVAQYIAEPVTVLHDLDPRVKQAWLLALVIVPSRAHISIRLGLVIFLLLATVFSLPRRIWQVKSRKSRVMKCHGSVVGLICNDHQAATVSKDQLSRMLFLSGLLFVFTAIGSDGVPPIVHQRTPPPSMDGLPELLPSLSGYSYVVMKFGPVQLTRKGLALAAAASCLSFTVLQSATLCLTTTTPERLAAGLQWFLAPLSRFRAPVDETILTLLLSLRFIGLVFDEVRNIALAVVARGVQWESLRLMETADTFFSLFRRLFKNLLNHAEKISEAMVARGFKGDASNHHIYFLTPLSLTGQDKLAILGLVFLVLVSLYSSILLPT